MNWQTSRFSIALDRPLVMGIVNATPDSFSDGGRYAQSARALQHCEQLIKDGADILDIGGESTRPGSPAVGLEEEFQVPSEQTDWLHRCIPAHRPQEC